MFNECAAVYRLSRISAHAPTESVAVAQLLDEVRAMPITRAAGLNLRAHIEDLPAAALECDSARGGHHVTLALTAALENFGALELVLEPGQAVSKEFLAILSQQIALAVARAHYEKRSDRLLEDLNASKENLATRKAVQRACGLLSRFKSIAPHAAEALLRRRAAEQRQSVLGAAEAIIEAYGHRQANRPLRRSA